MDGRMYSFDSTVRYSECDEKARMTLTAMMNYLQDCSTFHSESLNIGLAHLTAHHQGWVLASWEIEIEEFPAFNTKITTSTWCYAMKRNVALRNFQIADGSGTPVVRADSKWLLFDFDAGKPMTIPDEQKSYISDDPRLDMPPMERKYKRIGEGAPCEPIVVSEHNLDTNHHVNNAQYVLFAEQALAEHGLSVELARLGVQYRKMAWLGDTIVPTVYECEGGYVVDLADEAGSTYSYVKMQGRQAKNQ